MTTETNQVAYQSPPTAGMSAEIGAIAKALAKAQAEITTASKGSYNPHFKSRYADLGEVWDVCRAVLPKNGIAVTQTTECNADDMFLITMLMHESGQWIRGVYLVRPQKSDPQGFGSAITYARRYALAAAVGVVADDDDDGNGASSPPRGPQRTAPASAQRQAPARDDAPTDPRVSDYLAQFAAATTADNVKVTEKGMLADHKVTPFSDVDRATLKKAMATAMARVEAAAA